MDEKVLLQLKQVLFEPTLEGVSLALAVIMLAVVGVMLIKWQRYRQYLKSDIRDIDKMTGVEFERYLEHLFKKLGYKVSHVSEGKTDYGCDLVVKKDGVKIAVQAKRYQSNVGVKAIQEVVGAKKHYRCQRAMVVTNAKNFTKSAWTLARSNKVTLWYRKRLMEKVLQVKG